jgi:hypothetical protein
MKTAKVDLDHAQVIHKAARIRMTWTPRERRRRSTRARDLFRRFARRTLGTQTEEIWAVGALTDSDLRRLATP